MPDKKLTDNEIKKALECCSNRYDCYSCEYYNQYCKGDMNVTLKDALGLINRLQAKLDEAEDTIQFADKELKKANTEIERLKSDVSVSRDAYMSMKDRYEYEKEKVEKAKQKCIGIAKSLKTAKAEAVKEFAEKLKNEIIGDTAYGCDTNQHTGYYDYQIKIGDIPEYIDNLLKELVGENNETKTF